MNLNQLRDKIFSPFREQSFSDSLNQGVFSVKPSVQLTSYVRKSFS